MDLTIYLKDKKTGKKYALFIELDEILQLYNIKDDSGRSDITISQGTLLKDFKIIDSVVED